jgi:hypothetical protein
MKTLIAVSVLSLIFFSNASGQDSSLTAIFYNTENLFDNVDDSLKNDEEFLPDGPRRWTHSRYLHKLDAISRVIVTAGGWQAPAIVGLCEIENSSVAFDLANEGILANIGYSFVHYDSPDPRGIDICMLYRPDVVKIISHEKWIPVLNNNIPFISRNILFVKTSFFGDTIDIILCHWPSRRGGTLAADDLRKQIAAFITDKIDSINTVSKGFEHIIVMGDFNMPPSDEIVKGIEKKCKLTNLSDSLTFRGKGSYRYQGKWEMIDQVLLSENMICSGNNDVNCYLIKMSVLDDKFLLEDDPDYPGKRPFATYREYKWHGGFSDHLPVILTLHRR